MSQYIYRGPASGITLRGAKGAKTEVMLFDGKEVDLPDCAEVKTLVALKRLQPVALTATGSTAAASNTTAPAAPAAADAGASSPAAASPAAPASQKKGA